MNLSVCTHFHGDQQPSLYSRCLSVRRARLLLLAAVLMTIDHQSFTGDRLACRKGRRRGRREWGLPCRIGDGDMPQQVQTLMHTGLPRFWERALGSPAAYWYLPAVKICAVLAAVAFPLPHYECPRSMHSILINLQLLLNVCIPV